MLNQADSFLMTQMWTQTDEMQGSSNLQTRVVCCNIQPQAKGAVLFPSSPGWEMLGIVKKSFGELGKRGWKSKSKKVAKNAELEKAQGEKERTGEFNKSEEDLQQQASSGELGKGTWCTSHGQEQK